MSSISTAVDLAVPTTSPNLHHQTPVNNRGVNLETLQIIVPRLIDNGYAADIAVLIDVHPSFRSDPELLSRAISESAARLESISPETRRNRPEGRRDLFSDFIYWNHLAAYVLGHDDKVELFLANGANENFECSICHTKPAIACETCGERCCELSTTHESYSKCTRCKAPGCPTCLYGFMSPGWHYCGESLGGYVCPSCLESMVDYVMCRDCHEVECQYCKMNEQPYCSRLSDYSEWKSHRNDMADPEVAYYCDACLAKRRQRRAKRLAGR